MSRQFPSADLDAWITREPDAELVGECGGECGEMTIGGEPCKNPLDFCGNCPAENGRRPKLNYLDGECVYYCSRCGETYENIDTCGYVNGGE